MDSSKAISIAQEVFSAAPSRAANVRWWLFEHGTIVLVSLRACGEEQVVAEMAWLAEALGPHEGQGSVYGDANALPLRNHARTWVVSYAFSPCILTLVDVDDFTKMANRPPADEVVITSEATVRAREAVGDLRAGICGRMKRNRDARERKIIARSDDPALQQLLQGGTRRYRA